MLNVTNDMIEILNLNKSIVAFTAEWCQPCKQLKPHFAKAGIIDKNNNYFVVDVDKIDKKYLDDFNIKSIPAVFVLENGEITKKIESKDVSGIMKEVS